jgi:uncharacterized membrane protein
MDVLEKAIVRWQSAGLLDQSTVEAIRNFESSQQKKQGIQWQVVAALILGGILLGAGVLLFVAAHWASLSPMSRFSLVISVFALFHIVGINSALRFPALASTTHALGTISSGAAIALLGQIFNMQQHWPSAVLLWALCSAAGWLLLKDQFHQIFTLLLLPVWIISEWDYQTYGYTHFCSFIARIFALFAMAYLAIFLRSNKSAVRGVLVVAASICVPLSICILMCREYPGELGSLPISFRIAVYSMMALAPVIAFFFEKQSLAPVAVTALLALVLPWTTAFYNSSQPGSFTDGEPSLIAYLLVALASVFLVWWGVRIQSAFLLNLGMIYFALTVLFFCFSNVLDKLGRSFGLIVLGVVFLAGGWALERTRRRLMTRIAGGAL